MFSVPKRQIGVQQRAQALDSVTNIGTVGTGSRGIGNKSVIMPGAHIHGLDVFKAPNLETQVEPVRPIRDNSVKPDDVAGRE